MTTLTKEEWKKLAKIAVEEVARKKEEFTPDDIWKSGLPKPQEARALGGVMASAKKSGLIAKTGRVQPTTQRESHGTDVTVWRSLIYIKP